MKKNIGLTIIGAIVLTVAVVAFTRFDLIAFIRHLHGG